jgi:hypothetical protein
MTSRPLALFGAAIILLCVAGTSFFGVVFPGLAIEGFISGEWYAWICVGCGILSIAATFSIVRKVWRGVR